MTIDLDACLDRALDIRRPLMADGRTDAYRLFNSTADGIDGLVIERFADVLIVQVHEGRLGADRDTVRPAVQRLQNELGLRASYLKVFVSDRARVPSKVAAEHVCAKPWIGEAVEPQRQIVENSLRFVVHPYDGFSVGLFLEHRENRQRVRRMAAGRRVLNAFSYTGGFSVAAAAGGAASVSSVDLSRRYLEWSKRNFEANDLELAGHWFFCSDVCEFYRRAERQGRRYDLIVLDPPTFARRRRPKTAFVLAGQLGELVAGAVALLDVGGLILFATNCRTISAERLEEELQTAAGSRTCRILDRPCLPIDFAGDPDYSKTVIARFD